MSFEMVGLNGLIYEPSMGAARIGISTVGGFNYVRAIASEPCIGAVTRDIIQVKPLSLIGFSLLNT